MKTYINRVTAYFNSEGITFCQEDQGESVFVLFELDDISIFHLFDFEDGVVVNWSLLSWAVPEKRKNKIIDFLININSGLNGGLFYLDEQTGCIAFSRSYVEAPKENMPDRQSLENFCKEVLEVMPRYHKVIYDVAFKNDN